VTGQTEAPIRLVRVCFGPNCSRNFAIDLLLEAEALRRRAPDLQVVQCGCLSNCDWGPNLELDGRLYTDMEPQLLRRIIAP